MDQHLFNTGKFILSSGRESGFKIDCDSLAAADWEALAALAAKVLPPFGAVEGIPRGGLALAEAMRPYVTQGPLLLCDDVWTTGVSMRRVAAYHRGVGWEVIGLVAFARGPVEGWVTSLFQLDPRLWESA